MKYLKLFEDLNPKLSLKENKYFYNDRYSIIYDIKLNRDSIGKCEIESIFQNNNFNDKKDNIFYGTSKFNYMNPVKKTDFDKYKYIIHLNGFEIYEEYRGKGLGYKSFELILNSISKNFPKNIGIYLSVLKNNSSAIKIYNKLGFIQVQKHGNVIIMKK